MHITHYIDGNFLKVDIPLNMFVVFQNKMYLFFIHKVYYLYLKRINFQIEQFFYTWFVICFIFFSLSYTVLTLYYKS